MGALEVLEAMEVDEGSMSAACRGKGLSKRETHPYGTVIVALYVEIGFHSPDGRPTSSWTGTG